MEISAELAYKLMRDLIVSSGATIISERESEELIATHGSWFSFDPKDCKKTIEVRLNSIPTGSQVNLTVKISEVEKRSLAIFTLVVSVFSILFLFQQDFFAVALGLTFLIVGVLCSGLTIYEFFFLEEEIAKDLWRLLASKISDAKPESRERLSSHSLQEVVYQGLMHVTKKIRTCTFWLDIPAIGKRSIIRTISTELRERGYKVISATPNSLVSEKARTYGKSGEDKLMENIAYYLKDEELPRKLSLVDKRCKAFFHIQRPKIKITYEFPDDFLGETDEKACKDEIKAIFDDAFGWSSIKHEMTMYISRMDQEKSYYRIINEMRSFAYWTTFLLAIPIILTFSLYLLFPNQVAQQSGFVVIDLAFPNASSQRVVIDLNIWLLHIFFILFVVMTSHLLVVYVDGRVARLLLETDKEIKSLPKKYQSFFYQRFITEAEVLPKRWSIMRLSAFILTIMFPALIIKTIGDVSILILSPMLFFVFCFLSEPFVSSFQINLQPEVTLNGRLKWYAFTATSLPALLWVLFLYNSYMQEWTEAQPLGADIKAIIFGFLYLFCLTSLVFSILLFIISREGVRAKPIKLIESAISIVVALAVTSVWRFPRPVLQVSQANDWTQLIYTLVNQGIDVIDFVFLQVVPLALLTVALIVGIGSVVYQKIDLKSISLRKLWSHLTAEVAENVLTPVALYFGGLIMLYLSAVTIKVVAFDLFLLVAILIVQSFMMLLTIYQKAKLRKDLGQLPAKR